MVGLPGEREEEHYMQEKALGADSRRLTEEITTLTTLSVKELKERWRSLYRSEPHRRMSRELLTRAVAYRLQERALGGLKRSTRRLLARIAEHASEGSAPRAAVVRAPSAGTVLIREWRGVSHRVTVLAEGVVYRERGYRSLSQVARLITGSRWSGPLFFGLRARPKENGDGTR